MDAPPARPLSRRRAELALLLFTLSGVVGCGLAGLSRPTIPGVEVAMTGHAKGLKAPHRQGPGWYAVQLHAHSLYSDGVYPPKDMIAMAKNEGLDALGISDHDTTAQWLDPDVVAEDALLMLHSQEAEDDHGINHMGLHGMTGITPIKPTAPRDTQLALAAARHATIIINHPCNSQNPWTPLAADPRAHAVEVWNSFFWTPLKASGPALSNDPPRLQNEEGIAWWSANLAEGKHLTAIAASDFHRKPQKLASPCTLVWAERRSEAAILAGIRAGRTVLVDNPRAARLELGADADGDGIFEKKVGDVIPGGAMLRVRVTGAKGASLLVLRGKEKLLEAVVPGGDWSTDLVIPAGKNAAPFVYARLDGLASTMHAMTSALYLE